MINRHFLTTAILMAAAAFMSVGLMAKDVISLNEGWHYSKGTARWYIPMTGRGQQAPQTPTITLPDGSIAALYRTLGKRFAALDDWSLYMITSFPDAEKCIGRKADRNRKVYNGMMKTYFYQFMGPRPPKRKRPEENA